MNLLLALALGVSDDVRSDIAFDKLLNCWVEQWPNGEVPTVNKATPDSIARARLLATQNCQTQIEDHRKFVLARLQTSKSNADPDAERAADRQVKKDLDEMFDEFWSRL